MRDQPNSQIHTHIVHKKTIYIVNKYCTYVHSAIKPRAMSVSNNITLMSFVPGPPERFLRIRKEPGNRLRIVSAAPAAARSERKDKLVIRSGVLSRSEVTAGFHPSRGRGGQS